MLRLALLVLAQTQAVEPALCAALREEVREVASKGCTASLTRFAPDPEDRARLCEFFVWREVKQCQGNGNQLSLELAGNEHVRPATFVFHIENGAVVSTQCESREARIRRVRVGMKKDEVKRILGQPTKVEGSKEKETWRYCDPCLQLGDDACVMHCVQLNEGVVTNVLEGRAVRISR